MRFLWFFAFSFLLISPLNAFQKEDIWKWLKSSPTVKTDKDVLIFLYNKAECASCSGVIYRLFEAKGTAVPKSNRIILMPQTRAVEMPVFKERFSFLSFLPEFISDDYWYGKILGNLDLPGRSAGGFVLLNAKGEVQKIAGIKNREQIEALIEFINSENTSY